VFAVHIRRDLISYNKINVQIGLINGCPKSQEIPGVSQKCGFPDACSNIHGAQLISRFGEKLQHFSAFLTMCNLHYHFIRSSNFAFVKKIQHGKF